MPSFQDLKKHCRKVLKKYPELIDIILFGSFVKGKTNPQDIDIALILPKYKIKSGIIGKISMEFDNFKNIDIEGIDSEMIYMDPLFWRIAREGFSIKNNIFIAKSAQTKPVTIFEYSLNKLSKTQKVQFNRAIHNIFEKDYIHLVKSGSIFLPSSESEKFNELINSWNLNKKTRKTDAVFLGRAFI